ncbi:hypothetical protein [Rhodopirellula bahusiensis]|uniref:hypothetical protein n=1 Tax=Rhodopirellula bahusiensis TaxID=2014065 RepID=UPI0032652480
MIEKTADEVAEELGTSESRLTASTLAAVQHRPRLMSHATENVRQWAAQNAGTKSELDTTIQNQEIVLVD